MQEDVCVKETDILLEDMTSTQTNGIPLEQNRTAEEILDIETDIKFEFTHLAGNSQDKNPTQSE